MDFPLPLTELNVGIMVALDIITSDAVPANRMSVSTQSLNWSVNGLFLTVEKPNG